MESSLRNVIFGKIISLSMNPFGESARIYANFELSEDAPNNYLPIIDCKFFVFPIPWITLSDSAALTALIFLQHLVCRYFLIREKLLNGLNFLGWFAYACLILKNQSELFFPGQRIFPGFQNHPLFTRQFTLQSTELISDLSLWTKLV